MDNGNFVDFDPTNSYNESNTSLYIALKNPFRYRSYYYDTETGLYYLNSRYYDPGIGRFINIDDISVLDVTNIALNGINLYAYCLNNPVNEVDESGYFLIWLLGLLIAGVVFAVANTGIQLVSDVINYAATGQWNSDWEDYVGAFIGGFAGGVVFYLTGNLGLTFGTIGAVETLGTNLLTNSMGKTNYSLLEIASMTLGAFVLNTVIGSFGGKAIQGLTIGRNSFFAIFKSGLTKLSKEIVKKMSLKVLLKGFVAFMALKNFGLFSGILNIGINWVKQLLGEHSEIN